MATINNGDDNVDDGVLFGFYLCVSNVYAALST